MKLFTLLLLPILQLFSCSEVKEKQLSTVVAFQGGTSSYNFSKPKNQWDLPMELDEISGLTFYSENKLACVNDEEGKIFIYNLKKKKISKTMVFGKDGDYEGITYQKPFFYIINSSGKLTIYNEETDTKEKIKLPFGSKNNIEGLCIEDDTHLLLALKGRGGLNEGESTDKSIYRYSITSGETTLAYTIPKKKKIGLSGLAVHPSKKELMVLSHRTKEIYQLNTDTQEINFKWTIERRLFAQPEGICFAPDGRLFISNERADVEHATILEF
jgi:uncharacterized protein YjiK